MTVTVRWSSLDRVRNEQGWVFEVVPDDAGADLDEFAGLVVDASGAAELILNEDPDPYDGFSLPTHFPTSAGVGYWIEDPTSKKPLRAGLAIFTAELDQRGVDATIRAVRQNFPQVAFDHMDGIGAGALINGTRPTDPQRAHRWIPDPDDITAIFDLVLPWCADYGSRWWLAYSMMWLKVEPETFRPLARQFVLHGTEPTTLVAADTKGTYRRVHFGYSGNLLIAAGGPDPDGPALAQTVIDLLSGLAPHISHAFAARTSTNQLALDSLERNVWRRAGHEINAEFVHRRERPTAAFAVLGAQVLGPEFPTVEPAAGWTLTSLPGERRLLTADDRDTWFARHATADLIADTCTRYQNLTDTDPNDWRLG